jgi:PAS domain S-box-containing protein
MEQTRLSASELMARTRWYIRVRWFVLLAITVPGLVSLYIGSGIDAKTWAGSSLALIALGTNVVFYYLNRARRGRTYERVLAATLLSFDILLIAYFVYNNGGIESRGPILYVLPIVMSGALFGRRAVYTTTLAAVLTYDTLVTMDYLNFIHSRGGLTGLRSNLPYVINDTVLSTVVLLIIGVLTDFTTRLLVTRERQAAHSADALRRAQAIAKVGSWEWDVTHDIVTWSDELRRIFAARRRSGSLTYDDYLKLVDPQDRQRVDVIVHRALKNHRPFSFDYQVIRPDGHIRMVHTEGKVMTDRNGRVVQLYGTGQDITAERSLEDAKGNFVALASHQLRTPASGVRMLLALLRDGYMGPLTREQQAGVEQAFEANQRLLRIADDLLNVAKLEAGRLTLNLQQLELGAWLRTLLENQKLLVKEKNQKLRIQVPKEPVYASADPQRLSMALDNVLGNARKYTQRRGTITVSLQPGRSFHRLLVADNGSGITRQELGKLFGKFTRLDNQASRGVEGTGLGLYLTKSIVDLHKGSIRVSSKPGVGTTFTIRLPRALPPKSTA